MGGLHHLRVHPDGRRVAFRRGEELWVQDLDRNTTSRLGTGRNFSPTWLSNDELAYVAVNDVVRQRLDRTDPRGTIFAKPDTETEDLPSVIMLIAATRDAELLVLQNWDSKTNWDLWTFRPGDDTKPVTGWK